MRLSDEKARRLTALVWRERLWRFLPPLIVAVVLFGGLTVFFANRVARIDATVDVHEVDGTVSDMSRSGNGRNSAIVHVHLRDGRDVEAFSALRIAPLAGAHIVVSEARHASGKVTYDVLRLAE